LFQGNKRVYCSKSNGLDRFLSSISSTLSFCFNRALTLPYSSPWHRRSLRHVAARDRGLCPSRAVSLYLYTLTKELLSFQSFGRNSYRPRQLAASIQRLVASHEQTNAVHPTTALTADMRKKSHKPDRFLLNSSLNDLM
jgi:hypothetical protein